jgi:hypothetical protein
VKERKSWVANHNKSVRDELKSPHLDKSTADSLVDKLLEEGNITLGGTLKEDSDGRTSNAKEKPVPKKKSVSTARGRRSKTKRE